jgi:monooxygenase
MDHVDVVIVGAGISGVSAAWHLQKMCHDKSYTILEGRDAIGGTWDLFRYPGIRSDSDMFTLGFIFKPWKEAKAIADGPSILSYVNEAADEYGIRDQIRFNHQVKSASWSDADATWTVEAEHDGQIVRLSCNMLLMCGGYYKYDDPYRPEWDGMESFKGTIVHPQLWPENLEYKGKKVVIIGSGATAMTLAPAMANKGADHVTMLQRSPTYVVSWPSEDKIANRLRRWLPNRLSYAITRWKNVQTELKFYRRTRTEPEAVKAELIGAVKDLLGSQYDVEKHFSPSYNPWDQRLCLIPDDDLFNSINDGKASVVTEEIDRFVEDGLKLANGEVLKADIIISATGLQLEIMNGVSLSVDGKPVNLPDHWSYKGMMLSDVPNLIQTFGYINASWTLRADLTSEYAARLINRLDESGNVVATPRLREEDQDMPARPWIDDFPAGYMQRSMHLFPKQGDRNPWRNTQDFGEDKTLIRHALIEDDVLEFAKAPNSGRIGKAA